MPLLLKNTTLYSAALAELPSTNLLITTINAHSYNVAQKDAEFAAVLQQSDVLLPDGISVVMAKRLLGHAVATHNYASLKKIAGEDLFYYEMQRLQQQALSAKLPTKKAFFLGSTEEVLAKIKERAGKEFPDVELHSYSPPYKPEFSAEENQRMIEAINAVNPDVLFIGMTAPKQEKWAYNAIHRIADPLKGAAGNQINNSPLGVGGHCHICCIGAVFDFYAGTVNRAPRWIIKLGMEWLYRLLKEPRRMWRRYLIGNSKFILGIVRELFGL